MSTEKTTTTTLKSKQETYAWQCQNCGSIYKKVSSNGRPLPGTYTCKTTKKNCITRPI